MAKGTPIISRDGNVNTLNSDITSEVLYEAPGDNMSDKPFLMDVSERGHAEILDELTDLSANKGAYALREVYSNAHDATAKVGDMGRPIEITIPEVAWRTNSLAEKLALVSGAPDSEIEYAYVTDHGIGMTEYDLRTYFTQYGGSNKRDDASSIGSKGLGSKAPLAVADFFDVTTSKDGIRTSMHLWRAEDGNYAEVTGSEPCPADETGTTIRIPVMNPTIGSQMLECANEIARYNSDAKVIVNGRETSSTLRREVGSISHIDKTDYVHIGSVRIGQGADGSPVSVPVWLAKSVFDTRNFSPWTSDNASGSRIDHGNGGVRAVLCGIGYQLMESRASRSYYYYGNGDSYDPVCIVEVEPGYLNFTVSRDEIKDDARKQVLVDALREAVDSVNLWPIAIKSNAHDIRGFRSILEGRSLRNEGGRWEIVSSLSDLQGGVGYVLTDEDIESFTDADGHSFLPLLATFEGSDPDGHDAKLVAWFSSAYNGKSARFHVAYHDDSRASGIDDGNWETDLLSWKYGTNSQRGGDGENSFSPNIETIYKLVDEVIPTSQIASAVRDGFDFGWSLMVIGGVDAKSFSKAEHSIRRHVADAVGRSVLQTKVLYALCEGAVSDDPSSPDCLSDAELALAHSMGGHVEVAMLDDLAKTCAKEDRERRKAAGSKPKRKGLKPLGSFRCAVADIDSEAFADASDVVTATADSMGVPSRSMGTIRYETVDLDDLGHGDLVVLGRPSEERMSRIATQTMLLQKMGLIDASYDRITFVPASHDGRVWNKGEAVYAPQVKRLARQVTVLADIREDWAVVRASDIIGSSKFLTTEGVDIDLAGIRPNDMMRVMVATAQTRVGAGGDWLIKNMGSDLGLAKVAFGLYQEDSNRFKAPVMAIKTDDAEAKALTEWMESVWSVVGSYSFAQAISNIDDPDIESFVRNVIGGVMEEATKTYEAAVA